MEVNRTGRVSPTLNGGKELASGALHGVISTGDLTDRRGFKDTAASREK
jgi:hypothetical protein